MRAARPASRHGQLAAIVAAVIGAAAMEADSMDNQAVERVALDPGSDEHGHVKS